MKLAIPYDNGNVYPHFGNTEYFKIYTFLDNCLVGEEILSTEGASHIELVSWLKDHEVNVLLCGGIGDHGRTALALADIKFFPGVQGDTDENAFSYIKGTLQYNMNATCSSHGCHH